MISPEAYQQLANFLRERSGYILEPSKEYLLDRCLGDLLTPERKTMDALVAELLRDPHGRLAAQVVQAVSVHETSFFRDGRPFAALREVLQAAGGQAHTPLKIWSAAASTGQEVYSVAIMADELGLPVELWATDLCEKTVAQAQEGRYLESELVRGLSPGQIDRHFVREGDAFRVTPRIRNTVRFRALNLLDPWPVLPPMDLILLRNVLIYFDDDTRARVLRRAAQQLSPSGVLVIGATESMIGLDVPLQQAIIGGSVFYRSADPDRPGHSAP